MLETKRYKFGSTQRLRSQPEFDRAFAKGRRFRGRELLLIFAGNELGRPRLGISIGRRFGNAVQRNRMKRKLREAFRLIQYELPAADIVCVPYPKAAELSVDELKERLLETGEICQNKTIRQ
jgi:ribonuclease P protein component